MIEAGRWNLINPRKEIKEKPTHSPAEKQCYIYVATSNNFQLTLTDHATIPITKPKEMLTETDERERISAEQQITDIQEMMHRRETLWYQLYPIKPTILSPLQENPSKPQEIISEN